MVSDYLSYLGGQSIDGVDGPATQPRRSGRAKKRQGGVEKKSEKRIVGVDNPHMRGIKGTSGQLTRSGNGEIKRDLIPQFTEGEGGGKRRVGERRKRQSYFGIPIKGEGRERIMGPSGGVLNTPEGGLSNEGLGKSCNRHQRQARR